MASAKENLQQTLNHEQSDRMVVDLGATLVTGIHVLVTEQIKKHFRLEQKPEGSGTFRGSWGIIE